MRRPLLSTAAAFLVAAGATDAAYQPRVIAPEDARSDVELLRRALETVHPGLYRYSAKAEVDAAFARVEARSRGRSPIWRCTAKSRCCSPLSIATTPRQKCRTR